MLAQGADAPPLKVIPAKDLEPTGSQAEATTAAATTAELTDVIEGKGILNAGLALNDKTGACVAVKSGQKMIEVDSSKPIVTYKLKIAENAVSGEDIKISLAGTNGLNTPECVMYGDNDEIVYVSAMVINGSVTVDGEYIPADTEPSSPETKPGDTSSETAAPLTPEEEEIISEMKKKRPNIQGELKVEEMSVEEIKDLGIDVEAAENNHFYNYSIELVFDTQTVILHRIEDRDNKLVDFFLDIIEKIPPITLPPTTPGTTVSTGSTEPPSTATTVRQTLPPVGPPSFKLRDAEIYTEGDMFFIIYGESKWLKEFYDVQLVLMNTENEDMTSVKDRIS